MNHAFVAAALDFASAAHAGQTRTYSGDPYFFHCLDVLKLLQERLPPPKTLEEELQQDRLFVAAVLHDTVEDTDVKLWVIEANFGVEVATLVDELSSKEDKSLNRAARKESEAQRLSKISADAQTIKYADIICNLRDIDQHDPEFAKIYKAEKRRALMLMTEGNQSLRNTAWLASLDKGAPAGQRFIMSHADAEKMVGG